MRVILIIIADRVNLMRQIKETPNIEARTQVCLLYTSGRTGKVNVHFTVSTEHRELFTKLVEEKVAVYAKKYGVEYDVSFSDGWNGWTWYALSCGTLILLLPACAVSVR